LYITSYGILTVTSWTTGRGLPWITEMHSVAGYERFGPGDLLLPLSLVPVVANLKMSGSKLNQPRLLACVPKSDVSFFFFHMCPPVLWSMVPVQHFSCIQLCGMDSIGINQCVLT